MTTYGCPHRYCHLERTDLSLQEHTYQGSHDTTEHSVSHGQKPLGGAITEQVRPRGGPSKSAARSPDAVTRCVLLRRDNGARSSSSSELDTSFNYKYAYTDLEPCENGRVQAVVGFMERWVKCERGPPVHCCVLALE